MPIDRALLSIDPGKATGVSFWLVPQNKPIERINYQLVQDGLLGFSKWFANFTGFAYAFKWDLIILEEFIQDGRTPKVDLNAIEIQGYLKADALFNKDKELVLHRNSKKTTVGDKILKDNNLWVTGKQVDWADGRDVNDSQLHALAWGKENHKPTLEHFWPNKNKEETNE